MSIEISFNKLCYYSDLELYDVYSTNNSLRLFVLSSIDNHAVLANSEYFMYAVQ